MKVAFVTSYLSHAAGGIRDAVRGVAFALAKNSNIDVSIFGLIDPVDPEDSAAWGPRVTGRPARGPRALGWAPALDQALREEAPDLTDVHGIWTLVSLANLRHVRATGHPYMITPHGMLDPWALTRSRWKKRLAAALLESAHLKHAGCIRAIAEAEVQAVRAFGCPSPVAWIPNGVTLPEQTAYRENDGRSRRLLFLGRIDAKKGVEELLRAWAIVQAEAADRGWHLQVTGWGGAAYVERVRRLAIDLELRPETFTLTGPVFDEAKATAFRSASAFILPSFSEGLPMAVLEAWSYGLPTLLTANCNLPEGVAAGAAIPIDATTPKAIAESARALMRLRDAERHSIGDQGRLLVAGRFSWPVVSRELAATYKWLLGGGSPPACVVSKRG